MRVNGYKCDMCLEVVDVDFHKVIFPGGWFSLECYEKNERDEHHFCSLHCLHEWVEKQIPVVEESESLASKVIEYVVNAGEVNEYWRDL